MLEAHVEYGIWSVSEGMNACVIDVGTMIACVYASRVLCRGVGDGRKIDRCGTVNCEFMFL